MFQLLIKKYQKNIQKYRIKLKTKLKKDFNSEPVYNDKYLKTKAKIYNNKVYTNFQRNKIPKGNEYFECFSVISLDYILINSSKEYYPQILLEECKYSIKIKKQ